MMLNKIKKINQVNLELLIFVCSLDCISDDFLYFTSAKNRNYISNLAKKYVKIFMSNHKKRFNDYKKIDHFYFECSKINDEYILSHFYRLLMNIDANYKINQSEEDLKK